MLVPGDWCLPDYTGALVRTFALLFKMHLPLAIWAQGDWCRKFSQALSRSIDEPRQAWQGIVTSSCHVCVGLSSCSQGGKRLYFQALDWLA